MRASAKGVKMPSYTTSTPTTQPSYTQTHPYSHPYSHSTAALSPTPLPWTIPRIKKTPPPPPETLPIPYVRPQSPAKKLKPYPPPLLPSRPQPALWHPRNELQRRTSPTSAMFAQDTIAAPPAAALAVQPPLPPPQPFPSQSRNSSAYQRPRTAGRDGDEDVYVLTLKTSADVAGRMGGLRDKWFPVGRSRVPAHMMLFHALPSSRYEEVASHLGGVASRTRCFRISSGEVVRRRNGVAIAIGEGEREVQGMFEEAKEVWGEFLSDQDRGLRAHWTVQNKEEDARRVDEAFEDVKDVEVNGMAVGLVLWKYETDGRWTFEREFDFRSGDEEVRKDSCVVDDTGTN